MTNTNQKYIIGNILLITVLAFAIYACFTRHERFAEKPLYCQTQAKDIMVGQKRDIESRYTAQQLQSAREQIAAAKRELERLQREREQQQQQALSQEAMASIYHDIRVLDNLNSELSQCT